MTTTLLFKTAGFFAIWLVLSGSLHMGHLGLGLACAFAIAWVNTGRRESTFTPFPWLRFLLYLPWLLSRIVLSSLHLTALILHPRLPIAPLLVPYRTALRDHRAVVLLGQSVTLTPGTITVEVAPRELLIHAMDEQSATDLTSGRLEAKIAGLFHSREGS